MKAVIIRIRCVTLAAALIATIGIAGICPETMAFAPPAGLSVSASAPATAFPFQTNGKLSNPCNRWYLPGPSPSTLSSSPPIASSALSLWFFDFDENQIKKDLLNLPEILAAALVGIFFFSPPVFVVDAGYIGISTTLGRIERRDPGPHLRIPLLTKVTTLSVKTELLEQSNFVPTKEGLTVELDTAVLVKLDPDSALELFRTVGPDFVSKLVTPESSSSVRGLTSESEAKALYTSGRTELQNRLRDELRDKLEPRGIVVEDVLLKNVVLPESLSASIQEKARAEQESARMEFVLLKENQEAKRKAIEAQGIADFQRIVSDGITPSMLQWKGIEATEKLAKSPNSKVVIVGNTKDSLPIILGNSDK